MFRKLRSKLTRRLKRIEEKARKSAQRFVLRTLEKNAGFVQSLVMPAISSTGQASPTIQPIGNKEMDALLLAFLRSGQRSTNVPKGHGYGDADASVDNIENFKPRLSQFTREDAVPVIQAASYRGVSDLAHHIETESDDVRGGRKLLIEFESAQTADQLAEKICSSHHVHIYRESSGTADAQGCIAIVNRKAA